MKRALIDAISLLTEEQCAVVLEALADFQSNEEDALASHDERSIATDVLCERIAAVKAVVDAGYAAVAALAETPRAEEAS